MATLIVPSHGMQPAADFVVAALTLSEWLAEDWALLFSNPADFCDDTLNHGRWLSLMRAEFRERGVRPLALSRSPLEINRGWVAEVIGDESLVILDSNRRAAAEALRQHIELQTGRYVLIIDAELEPRGVLRYVRSAVAPLSPLDLLYSLDAIRHRVEHRMSPTCYQTATAPVTGGRR